MLLTHAPVHASIRSLKMMGVLSCPVTISHEGVLCMMQPWTKAGTRSSDAAVAAAINSLRFFSPHSPVPMFVIRPCSCRTTAQFMQGQTSFCALIHVCAFSLSPSLWGWPCVFFPRAHPPPRRCPLERLSSLPLRRYPRICNTKKQKNKSATGYSLSLNSQESIRNNVSTQ